MSVAEGNGISGLRILVADDELFCAMELEELLEQLGCNVIGPVNSIAKVLSSRKDIDCVLLDVNLRGEKSYDAANVLRDEGIPFAFVTGYTALPDCPSALMDTPKLAKPFSKNELADVIERISKKTG